MVIDLAKENHTGQQNFKKVNGMIYADSEYELRISQSHQVFEVHSL